MRKAGWLLMTMVSVAPAAAQDLPKDSQIAQAVMAAPEVGGPARRCWALSGGKRRPLRPGTNDLVCLADNPAAEGFSVACYHKDLDPFMARGREMTAKGITDDKVRDQTRFDENQGRQADDAERATDALRDDRQVGRTGHRQGRGRFDPLGDLRPVRHGETTGLATRPAGPGAHG